MRTADFHYDLPARLIAQQPARPRDASRLLCLDKVSGQLLDDHFHAITRHLRPNDVLVFNDTEVIAARLFGQKPSGGQVEILIERILGEDRAEVQIKASKPVKPGTTLILKDAPGRFTVQRRIGPFYELTTQAGESVKALLNRAGHVPLPPYIKRTATPADAECYQTVYARRPGAVAAPTAGLHFTSALLRRIRGQGCRLAYLTLHVGAATFQPLKVADIRDHRMHAEWFAISEETAEVINETKASGGRVIAVGTTSLRSLEAASTAAGQVKAMQAETDIFIYPGFGFKVVDALITNFHLPESTLLMLVSAFASQEAIRCAYAHAIARQYRFFSYGDAMFIGEF